ncbi:MAG: DUF1949 domain-containing protein [Clostridia bacterium]|nr:DUF1949 domain-containing protein [Clostridia bacterium]
MEFYFGTGGLVRAYSYSLSEVINKSNIIQKTLGYIVDFKVRYNDLEKIKYYFRQNGIRIIDNIFTQDAILIVEIKKEKYTEILNKKEELSFKIFDTKILKECIINYE